MRRGPAVVTAQTTFDVHVVTPRGSHPRSPGVLPVRVRMRFLRSDPHAVYLQFCGTVGGDVEWVFARSLLVEGLRRRVGAGDVRIAPLPTSGGAVVLIELRGANGSAVCHAPAADVAAFLTSAEQVVPVGAESEVVDVDAELLALLSTEGA